MVMYVSVRMLLPCWIVVWLSASAVCVSTTLVMVEIYTLLAPRSCRIESPRPDDSYIPRPSTL